MAIVSTTLTAPTYGYNINNNIPLKQMSIRAVDNITTFEEVIAGVANQYIRIHRLTISVNAANGIFILGTNGLTIMEMWMLQDVPFEMELLRFPICGDKGQNIEIQKGNGTMDLYVSFVYSQNTYTR